jgi:hypothetical protein
MAQVGIFSGPLEGLTAARGRPGELAHLELVVVRRRRPGEGRALYRFEQPEAEPGRWVFAAGRESVCGGCGATYRRAEGGSEDQGCPLCGGTDGRRPTRHE